MVLVSVVLVVVVGGAGVVVVEVVVVVVVDVAVSVAVIVFAVVTVGVIVLLLGALVVVVAVVVVVVICVFARFEAGPTRLQPVLKTPWTPLRIPVRMCEVCGYLMRPGGFLNAEPRSVYNNGLMWTHGYIWRQINVLLGAAFGTSQMLHLIVD